MNIALGLLLLDGEENRDRARAPAGTGDRAAVEECL